MWIPCAPLQLQARLKVFLSTNSFLRQYSQWHWLPQFTFTCPQIQHHLQQPRCGNYMWWCSILQVRIVHMAPEYVPSFCWASAANFSPTLSWECISSTFSVFYPWLKSIHMYFSLLIHLWISFGAYVFIFFFPLARLNHFNLYGKLPCLVLPLLMQIFKNFFIMKLTRKC